MIINNSNGPDGLTAFPGGMLWSPLAQVFVGNFVGNKHRLPNPNKVTSAFSVQPSASRPHVGFSSLIKACKAFPEFSPASSLGEALAQPCAPCVRSSI